MHNIDRTLQELESSATTGEYENSFEFESSAGEYGQEMEQEFGHEYSGEVSQQESQELEMAYQLLEISNEQELNLFLGDLLSKAASAVKGAATSFVASPTGQSVGKYLVDVGRNTLPQLGAQYGGQAGGALGSRAGAALGGRLGPLGAKAGGFLGNQAGKAAGGAVGGWAGTQAGNWLANNAQRIFNLEFEGLNPESQELEIARAYVRFASDVSRRAARLSRLNPRLSPAQLGRQVLGVSVPQLAPGLADGLAAGGAPGRQASSGTWVRRGSTLVLYDA
ncbi:hypothetical protein E5K00_05160 [Hymenobacter aquaticus]|uniref:Uncharacterized protein n=1 Tax=Hymenobacter aquaticus TaxID=1867101 RepID=A0A4Z0Q4T5_9BACT|nr:hypothetical protein [Hymenobacter aquaticus]TGE24604.1 hypothetical protein E5K00_05160 [Hymenobacter aquaticus]